METTEKKDKKKKRLLIILIVFLFLASAVGVVYLMWVFYNNYMAENTYNNLASSYVEVEEKEPELADNPVDFKSLTDINTDVYAWISIPSVNIEYPIVQNEETDYYLRRSIYKKYLFAGCIYTNKVNSKDFSDPVTLIYGHNMRNNTMFCDLHKFEKADFFQNKDNEYFYIYTPGRKLTYRIISALKYDNRRITTAFDFSETKDILDYQYSILNPKFDLFNVREGMHIDETSKIVTLSTCMANKPAYRYLVNGVLVKDEQTK